MAERLLTLAEVAEYLGVPEKTIYVWRSAGRPAPRGIRVGRHVRFKREDLDRWIEGQSDPKPVA